MALQSELYSGNYAERGFGLDSELNFNMQRHQKQKQQLMELQPQEHLQFQFLPQKNESVCFEKNGFTPKYINQSLYLSSAVYSQMEKQRQEIDQFLIAQYERLRLALLEHGKQQVKMILKKSESKASVLLRRKDEEITRALNKQLEFQNMIRAMETESQRWQRVAKENEAMVISLNNTIEQLKENAICLSLNNNAGADQDAESCCDDNRELDFQENEEQRRICKSCYTCNSCVIFIPCRHLASCKTCDVFLDTCPICGMAKNSIIEVLF